MSAPPLQGDLDWDDEITRTTQLFLEADRLDAAAYSILDAESKNRGCLEKIYASQGFRGCQTN